MRLIEFMLINITVFAVSGILFNGNSNNYILHAINAVGFSLAWLIETKGNDYDNNDN